jgi:hypothetical protein
LWMACFMRPVDRLLIDLGRRVVRRAGWRPGTRRSARPATPRAELLMRPEPTPAWDPGPIPTAVEEGGQPRVGPAPGDPLEQPANRSWNRVSSIPSRVVGAGSRSHRAAAETGAWCAAGQEMPYSRATLDPRSTRSDGRRRMLPQPRIHSAPRLNRQRWSSGVRGSAAFVGSGRAGRETIEGEVPSPERPDGSPRLGLGISRHRWEPESRCSIYGDDRRVALRIVNKRCAQPCC